MRAKLGPASRAAAQLGATFTSREMGTSPLTAPGNAVGRLSRLIGLAAFAAGEVVPINTNDTATPTAIPEVGEKCARIRAFNQGGTPRNGHRFNQASFRPQGYRVNLCHRVFVVTRGTKMSKPRTRARHGKLL